MTEIWKPIKGYEGFYEVSNTGKVRSLDRVVMTELHPGGKLVKGQVLKNSVTRRYNRVNLCVGNVRRKHRVARLVAIAFIPNPYNKTQVNHIDENTLNDAVENLEWCTPKENCNYGTRGYRTTLKNSKHIVTFKGISNPLSMWAKELGVKYSTLYYRLAQGKSIEEVLSQKVGR